MTPRRLSRDEIAQAIANDIEDGWYVNLGIGMPTRIAAWLPEARDIVLHSENGILGMGAALPGAAPDFDLINAGKEFVRLLPGAAITDHTTSFAMMRGDHLDLTVLGAFEVSERGDLANWDTGEPGTIPAVGGAMDLVVGARRVHVAMQHTTREGAPRIVRRCSLPLTGAGVVDRIYTDLAVIDVAPDGLVVRAMVPGLELAGLQDVTAAPLRLGAQCARYGTGADAAP